MVAHEQLSIRTSRRRYLEDELLGHLPGKLWSTEVAVRGCLLVDGPLQVQFPEGGNRGNESSEVGKSTR